MLISIETYRIFDFPGGPGPHTPLDPRMRMIDPLAISKFSSQQQSQSRRTGGFFSCNCSFSIPGASSDTSKHDEVYDSAIC